MQSWSFQNSLESKNQKCELKTVYNFEKKIFFSLHESWKNKKLRPEQRKSQEFSRYSESNIATGTI